jgi:hypothetical protein
VLWYTRTCSLRMVNCPDGGSNRCLHNFCTYLHDYKSPYLKTQQVGTYVEEILTEHTVDRKHGAIRCRVALEIRVHDESVQHKRLSVF